ncbi:MAG: carboxymuconolactone decarboxylase family protein [Phycisphaerales bacterium]
MARIEPLTVDTASTEGAQILNAIKEEIGMIPNLYATMAHSPAALSAALAFGEAMGKSTLSPQVKEQLALAIAGANSCDYCASAHTAIGKMSGLDADELSKNLTGSASDPKVQALLSFATTVVKTRGDVADSDISEARGAGVTDAEIVEVIATVAINTFTNYFNHIAQTKIDFPVVETSCSAC